MEGRLRDAQKEGGSLGLWGGLGAGCLWERGLGRGAPGWEVDGCGSFGRLGGWKGWGVPETWGRPLRARVFRGPIAKVAEGDR